MSNQKNYSEKLRDPRWQKKRLKILERDNFTCVRCLDTTTTLNAHHRYYIEGREPWEYDDFDLITLCDPCHEIEGEIIKQKKKLVSIMKSQGIEIVPSCVACGNIDPLCYHPYVYHCNVCGWKYNMKDKEDL